MSPSRRDFVKAAAAAAGAALVPPTLQPRSVGAREVHAAEEHGWERVPSILARIKPPTFAARTFPVTRYGAKADGVSDSSEAFRRAIGACAAAGGGRVVVEGGTFLTGPIHLKSNINLHFEEGVDHYAVVMADPEGNEFCLH